MFRPRHYFVPNLALPFFIELVVGTDVLTMRVYEEVVSEGIENEPDRYRSAQSSSSYVLSPSAPSPVGRHVPAENGLRPSLFFPRERALVPGEELSSSLHGKSFVEFGATCLDRHDPTLASESWSDAGEWHFAFERAGRLVPPYIKNSFTPSKRIPGGRFSAVLGQIAIFRLFQPFKETSFDQCSMVLSINPSLGFRVSIPLEWEPGDVLNPATFTSLLPELRWAATSASNVATGESVRLEIECVDPVTGERLPVTQGDVVIEADSGYLPIRRKTLADGAIEVSLKAWELPAGHRIRVSAGFEGSPARLSREITVV